MECAGNVTLSAMRLSRQFAIQQTFLSPTSVSI
jgi:hypothetical protein